MVEQYRPARFNLLPEVVKNLLIINGIFFLATFLLQEQGVDLADILGLHYFASEEFRWYQLITYMFMHGSFAHIFFNMFALWMFGQAIENVWGPKRFLTYYLITGLGAAVTHYAVVYFEMQPILNGFNEFVANQDINKLKGLVEYAQLKYPSREMIEHYNEFIKNSPEFGNSVELIRTLRNDLMNTPVVVGASGAVFGLLLAYGMLFPDSIIYIYFALPIKAKYFVILYGAIELFSGIANIRGDNVAHFAHLGGLLFGFLIILYWREQNRRKRRDFFNP